MVLDAASRDATLIISIELPHLDLHEVVCFAVKPTLQETEDGADSFVVSRATEIVQDAAGDLRDHLQSEEHDATLAQLQEFRARALKGLQGWSDKLRRADEGLIKAESAKQQLNAMRECYHKELTVLREQLNLQAQAHRAGKVYTADDISLFDPTEYAFDDEAGMLLKQKAIDLQRRYDEVRSRLQGRLDDLTSKNDDLKWMLDRKDILVQGLLKEHNYSSERAAEQSCTQQRTAAGGANQPVVACSPAAAPAAARSADRKKTAKGNLFETAARIANRVGLRGGGAAPPKAICGCGNVLMADAKFCRKCGAARPESCAGAAADQAQRCDDCGNTFMPDSEFCRRCGAPRPDADQQVLSPLPAPAQAVQAAAGFWSRGQRSNTRARTGEFAQARRLLSRSGSNLGGPGDGGGGGFLVQMRGGLGLGARMRKQPTSSDEDTAPATKAANVMAAAAAAAASRRTRTAEVAVQAFPTAEERGFQTDLPGEDVEEAMNMLEVRRAEDAWRAFCEKEGKSVPVASQPGLCEVSCQVDLMPAPPATKAAGVALCEMKTADKPARTERHDSLDDVGDVVEEAEAALEPQQHASEAATAEDSTPRAQSKSFAGFATFGGVSHAGRTVEGILEKHGVPGSPSSLAAGSAPAAQAAAQGKRTKNASKFLSGTVGGAATGAETPKAAARRASASLAVAAGGGGATPKAGAARRPSFSVGAPAGIAGVVPGGGAGGGSAAGPFGMGLDLGISPTSPQASAGEPKTPSAKARSRRPSLAPP